nr:MAG TPA: hypothetical protein [Caudoviricetes sp.]
MQTNSYEINLKRKVLLKSRIMVNMNILLKEVIRNL